VPKAHEQLVAWQVSRSLVKDVYSLTSSFPKSEMYGLTSQMRRSAISVPTNIAEGSARRSAREFRNFLMISRGSLVELDTLLKLACDLELVKQGTEIEGKIDRVYGLLNGLISHQSRQISSNTQA
jgi:four helix bundle protein